MYDGKLHKSYEVGCAGCGKHISGLGYRAQATIKDAEQELRQDYDWKKIKGAWTCPDCIGKMRGETQ